MDTMQEKGRFVWKYPKFTLLFLTFIIAYFMFYGREFKPLHDFVTGLGAFGGLITGIFYGYGFTAGPATSILLVLGQAGNIIAIGLIAGIGALLSDMFTYKVIKHSLDNEIALFSQEPSVLAITDRIPAYLKRITVPLLGAFIILSPLPDEIGVFLMATAGTLSTRPLAIMFYILNTAGIFLILLIGRHLV